MTWTIVIAGVVGAAAVFFMARPIWRTAPTVAADDSADGLTQLRDRLLAQLRELDVEIADGNVHDTVAADERRRLQAELAQVLKRLDAVRPPAASAARARPRVRIATVLVLALAVPLAGAGLYLARNAPVLGQLEQLQAIARGDVPPMVLEMVQRLEQRLAEAPSDPEGWARLARAYVVLGREADARAAYARALELAPDDVDIVAAYADFLLSVSPARPSAEAVALFRQVHEADPQHPGALWALGVAAYQVEEYGRAAGYWERLLAQLPPEHELAGELRHAIDVARSQGAGRK